MNKTYKPLGYSAKPPKEHYLIPLMLILVSLECILSIFYTSNFILIIGVIGLLFGLFLLLVRSSGLENRLYPQTRQRIYFFSALIFLIQGGALVFLWLQMSFYSLARIGVLIFIFLAITCGLSMVLKTLNPDNSLNKLDPPF